MSATRTRLSVSTFGAEMRQARSLLVGLAAAVVLVVTAGAWLRPDPGLARAAQRATAGLARAAQRATDNPREILDLAIEDFLAGRLTESVAGFDRVVTLAPQAAPQLWQRGIALYYAGRYQDCRAQFESHRTVNPNDVENPAWHFMCVAKAESPAKARAALLPVGPDQRSPMREIYQMFRGTMTPEAILATGGTEPSARFFAELYVGLYYDAIGDRARATQHLRNAAAKNYAPA